MKIRIQTAQKTHHTKSVPKNNNSKVYKSQTQNSNPSLDLARLQIKRLKNV